MATQDNTSKDAANSESPATKPDYFTFCNDISHEVWRIHAMAKGTESIIENTDWESNEDLCAALYLIQGFKEKLQHLAGVMDESTYDYTAKLEASHETA